MFQKKLLCTYVTVNLIDNFDVLREGKKKTFQKKRVFVCLFCFIFYILFFLELCYMRLHFRLNNNDLLLE